MLERIEIEIFVEDKFTLNELLVTMQRINASSIFNIMPSNLESL